MFTEYSPLWLVPIVAIAAAVAYFAYFFSRKSEFLSWQRYTLAALRFFSLLLIMFLLISPVVKITKNVSRKPVVAIAQDVSLSLGQCSDSSYYRNEYSKALFTLAEKLNKDYDTKIYTFGAESNEMEAKNWSGGFAFEQSRTDISECIKRIEDDYSTQNLSAIVIASDGINNSGENPLNYCEKSTIPIFTIALGDTTLRKDIAISNIRYNRIAYMDDIFPIEITLRAIKADKSRTRVSLLQDGKTVFSQEVEIEGDKFSLTLPSTATVSKAGVQKFVVEATQAGNETNKENNRREFFVEILDSRQKISLLSAVVHPDISAIKQSISKNKNYTLTSEVFSERNSAEDYQSDMVIAHQLPNDKESYAFLKALQDKGTPVLYILGSATDYQLFNQLNSGLKISLYNGKSQTQTQASFNPNFTLFPLPAQTTQLLTQMPPVDAPLARWEVANTVQILAYQNIKGLKTEYPLLCFHNNPLQKCGIICGENIWKWRLQNYLANQSTVETDEFLHKSIQYLASGSDRSLFRVKHENIFNQSEEVSFEAELYDQSYNLINTPEVHISIRNSEGKEFKHSFSKTNRAYSLNAGTLEEGEYSYTATTSLSGENHTAKGSFVVSETQLESVNLVADHTLLRTLSGKTSGRMLYPQNMDTILELLQSNEQIRPVIHTETTNHRLIESLWYWIAILLLLSSEWFLRKYWGKI